MSKLYCARLHENFCFLLAAFEAGGHRPQPQGLRESVSREAHRLGVKTGGVPLGFKRRKRFLWFLSKSLRLVYQ